MTYKLSDTIISWKVLLNSENVFKTNILQVASHNFPVEHTKYICSKADMKANKQLQWGLNVPTSQRVLVTSQKSKPSLYAQLYKRVLTLHEL